MLCHNNILQYQSYSILHKSVSFYHRRVNITNLFRSNFLLKNSFAFIPYIYEIPLEFSILTTFALELA